MKKIYALLLTIVMCLSASITVSAATPALTATGDKAERNDYVLVTLTLENCDDANTLSITYEYDSDVLKKIANRCKWSMEGDLTDFAINKNEGVWYSKDTNGINGEICVLGFRISDTAPIGKTTVKCTVTAKAESRVIDTYTVEAVVEVTCAHVAGDNAVGTKVDEEKHKYECDLCGTDIVESHIWDKGVVTKPATEEETGIKLYTCSFCKATKEETIPVIEPEDDIFGDEPGGDEPGGDEPGGDEPGGDEPGGDTPGGDEPGGDAPGGDEPGGDTPGGNTPGGDTPGGNTPGGDSGNQGGNTGNQGGNAPGGNEPDEDESETDTPETNKPETNKPETNKPETNKPETNKPETNKPENNKPETTPDSEPSAPVVEMEEADVKETVGEIQKAEDGKEVVVEMKQENGTVATVVPVEILEAVKGKDVDVVLNMGVYSWTINGKDVAAQGLKDINLQVTLDTKVVDEAVVKALAGEDTARQISLEHDGEFNFKATLKINVGKEFAGKFGNLYYHEGEGKLTFVKAGKVEENGDVNLEFNHASDYVVVLGEDRTAEESQTPDTETPDTQKPDDDTQSTEPDGTDTPSGDKDNGGDMGTIVIVILAIAVIAGGVFVYLKKNNKI